MVAIAVYSSTLELNVCWSAKIDTAQRTCCHLDETLKGARAGVYILCMSGGTKEDCRFDDSSSSGQAQKSG